MRTLIFIIAITFTACSKQNDLPTAAINDPISANTKVVAAGTFQNGPYGNVMGTAGVLLAATNTYEVVLDSFSTSNGPDLHVYLSKEIMPVNFIEIGKLKSTNGRQVYALPQMPDLAQYKYVAIHCKSFNHLFGYALLP